MKIFGQHDEATIQQLKRCAAAERDAPAVLCADGHLQHQGTIEVRHVLRPRIVVMAGPNERDPYGD